MGSIVQKEWACGILSEINTHWKWFHNSILFGSPSTVQLNYGCVARATDDDGNQATDTTHVTFSSEVPIVTVNKEKIYVKAGDYV
jgi:hypothetical protein